MTDDQYRQMLYELVPNEYKGNAKKPEKNIPLTSAQRTRTKKTRKDPKPVVKADG